MPETTTTPLSKRDPLEDVAPYPKTSEEATSAVVGKHYAAFGMMHSRLLNRLDPRLDDHWWMKSIGHVVSSFTLVYLLKEIEGRAGTEAADEVATVLWEELQDGSGLHEYLWEWVTEYGIDPQRMADIAGEVERNIRAKDKATTTPSPLPLGEEREPGDVWKVSDETVPIGGVAAGAIVSCPDWNDGHPVAIVEIEDGRRAYGVTFAAWRDVRKPEGRSTIVRVPSDTQVAPCTLNGTTGEES